jgi:hypothetical protein
MTRLSTASAAALTLALALSQSVLAQDKKVDKGAGAPKAVIKVLHEDEKVRVVETTYAPGAESEGNRSVYRVTRALKPGTLQRIYPDGKTENIEWKEGTVRVNKPSGPYRTKNVGKSEMVLYAVQLK